MLSAVALVGSVSSASAGSNAPSQGVTGGEFQDCSIRWHANFTLEPPLAAYDPPQVSAFARLGVLRGKGSSCLPGGRPMDVSCKSSKLR